jgi:uncharacterized protein
MSAAPGRSQASSHRSAQHEGTPVSPTRPGLAGWPSVPLLGSGMVRHTRLRPTGHAFAYPACFLWLPLRALARQPRLLAEAGLHGPWLRFEPGDHGAGATDVPGLVGWADRLLCDHGITDADGELWLQCFPRVLGHAFKPVSFWHALRADGSLRATVAEVNNTFGERHCYVLDGARWGVTHRADKVFHVSPFCPVAGRYDFRFLCTADARGPRSVVRIDHTLDDAALLQTSIGGRMRPATPAVLRRAFWTHPVQSWAVTARIHWQALLLWIKGVPVHTKPAPPAHPVSVAPLVSPHPPATQP